VIEKFGVPPEKVVEVQALRGIRPTTCRACGIGVKDRGAIDRRIRRPGNAAGARRRDQAAEAARGADRECEKGTNFTALVLLDDKVNLDVPARRLAVHEPDARS